MASDTTTSRYGAEFPAGRWIALASVLAALIFLGLAWHVSNTFRAGAAIKADYLRGERVHDQFDALQQKLAMAAALAAGTGDESWFREYASLGQQLETELAAARAGPTPGYDLDALERIATAHAQLRRIEARALAMARDGRPAAALEVLGGADYHRLGAQFNTAASAFSEAHARYLDARLQAEARREAWSLGSAVVVFAIVLALWLILVARLRRWHRALLAEARQRALLQEQLAATAARYRALFEQGFDGMLLVDPESGRLTDCNRHAAGMLGYEREQLLALRLDDVRDAHSGAVAARCDLPERPMPCRVGECHYRRRDGSLLPVETGECIVEVAGGHLHQIRLRDLSERDQLRDALVEAQRMEAMGQLAAGAAHDFNNLLTVIYGYVFLARRKLGLGQPALHELDKLEEVARQAGELTRSLLAVGRHAGRENRPVEVNALLESVRGMLGGIVPASISIEVRAAADPLWVDGDSTQLTQALLNLAINARDAMPCGGHLVLGAERLALGAPGFRPLTDDPGRELACLWVRDDGEGMSAESLRHAFEPFFTTKTRGRGTGLGLAVVHGIMRSHGGEIHVESAPGAGTTAYIYLPAAERGAWPAPDQRTPIPDAAPDATGMVLLADNNRYVREMLATALGAAGLRVRQVADGPGLMQVFQEPDAAIEAVVADLDLPGMDGRECLAQLRARGTGVPGVLMTSTLGDDLEDALDGEALVLRKPFATSDLIRILRRLTSGGKGAR